MKTLFIIPLIALSLGACATNRQTTGAAAGVVTGAVIAGPVGAVVGGVAGAAVTAPGVNLGSGVCYVRDRRGNMLVNRYGVARTRRC
jgi:outer membrane lipoprotein SlyB